VSADYYIVESEEVAMQYLGRNEERKRLQVEVTATRKDDGIYDGCQLHD
jgi:hypothetical protein